MCASCESRASVSSSCFTLRLATQLITPSTASGSTTPTAFGRKLDGSPAHPYAWVAWSASGAYNPTLRVVETSVSGTLTVETEVLRPGGADYPRQNFTYGPVRLGTDGVLTVTPGGTFNGVRTFTFRLP